MSGFLEPLKRACRLASAASALSALAIFAADAAPCDRALDGVCKSIAFSAYAQVDDEDDDDDDDDDDEEEAGVDTEEFGDVDVDDVERDFEYDEDEGSLLVDIENCEPGKYWMMNFEDGVMLPCR
jgi:hypothetical protein